MHNIKNKKLNEWLEKWKKILQPESFYWCDGSDEEYTNLCEKLIASGTFRKLNENIRPNSYVANSDPKDVARVEECTFICSKDCADAGPTNNWFDPEAMRVKLHSLYNGAMKGRTMYVIPFSMGPVGSSMSKIGVQITDSAYVAVNMKIMTRMGNTVFDALNDDENKEWIPCIHSVGAPLLDNTVDVPWPCNNENKYIVHFPESREIWSFGSGYGGNALLGKKCFALRIASVMGRDNGWLAEHMLILKLTNPEGKVKYIVAAFPSSCGKTNLAMMVPSIPGWKVETIGDDICWMKFGSDGRLYAINPESGFFGVAAGTGWKTNANAMQTLHSNCIFTNTATTHDNDVWWEGMTSNTPDHLTDWQNRHWNPNMHTSAAHPNSRFTVSANQCPCIAPEWNDPNGVPISAIIFGGRRSTTIPLVAETFDWNHGVFFGSTMASETTAAADGALGKLRFDPMAMLPFCGYNMADYFHHWLKIGSNKDTKNTILPKIFIVNWFRRNKFGEFIWPGFSENIRVLKWIFDRVDGKLPLTIKTPIGYLPCIDDLDIASMNISKQDVQSILNVDVSDWREYITHIKYFYNKFENRIPNVLQTILQHLEESIF